MTVGELIKELENYDEDMEVVACEKEDMLGLMLFDIVRSEEDFGGSTVKLIIDTEEDI